MTPEFKTIPYKHQLEAFYKGWPTDYYAYFMEMGTGKSKVAIDDFCMNYAHGNIDAVLIFANNGSYRNWAETQLPAHMWDRVKRVSYIGVWKEDSGSVINDRALDPMKKFFKIFVMNIEALAFDKGFEAAMTFVKDRRAMLVVDESTTVKNKDAKRTKNLLKIAAHCKRRRIMTGDPITNSPLDLYSQCSVLSPRALGFGSFFTFKAYFAIMVQMNAGQRSFKKVTGYKNLSELTERLKSFSYRVKKEECLDLPPKVYQKVFVELTPEQKKLYEQIREEAIAELVKSETEGSTVTATLAITKMLKLHQITCGHVYDDEGKAWEIKSNRLQTLMDQLAECNGKVIIWANYRHDIPMIAKEIAEEYGLESVRTYYGDTSDEDRVEAVKAFQDGEARFFVGNSRTGGFGITLTAASTVIYFSNNFELEIRRQSEDRAHRIGQTKSVNYIDIVCKGTIDEKIIKALRSYSQVASATLGDTWREWI